MNAKISTGALCLGLLFACYFAGHRMTGTTPLTDGSFFKGLLDGDIQPAAEALTALFVLVAFVSIFIGSSIVRLPIMAFSGCIALLWILIWLSLLGSEQFDAGRLEAARWSVALLVCFTTAAVAGRGSYAAAIMTAIAVAGTLCSIEAIWEYTASAQFDPGYRAFGTFYNPDYFAGFLLMSLFVSLSLASTADQSTKLLMTTMIPPQLLALLLTGSRFGLVIFIISSIIWFGLLLWFKVNIKAAVARYAAVVLTTLVFASLIMIQFGALPGSRSISLGQESHSGQFRIWTWKGTLNMIAKSPVFGHGIGSYEYQYTRYSATGYTQDAHNYYLQLMAGCGIPCFVLFLIAGIVWFRKTLSRNAAKTKSAALLPENLNTMLINRAGIIASVAAALLRNGIDSDLAIFANLIVFWALIGLGLSMSPDGFFPEFLPPASRWIAVGALGVPLAIHFYSVAVAGMFAALGATTAHNVIQGKISPSEGISQAKTQYLKALQYEPGNAEYRLSYAEMLTDDEAVHAIENAVRVNPSAKTYTRLAYALMNSSDSENLSERLKQAEAAFEKAISYNPHDPTIRLKLAEAYRLSGQTTQWKETLIGIIELQSKPAAIISPTPEFVPVAFGEAHYLLGVEMMNENRVPDAVEHFKQAETIYNKYVERTRPILKRFIDAGLSGVAGYNLESDKETLIQYSSALTQLAECYQRIKKEDLAKQAQERLTAVQGLKPLDEATETNER